MMADGGALLPGKISSGCSTMGTRMNCSHIGRAAKAPASLLPSDFFSSKPIQTPHVIDGENPINQASVKSLVVPVLPPRGCFSLADRKSTRLNSSHVSISYAVFCLKKKKTIITQ